MPECGKDRTNAEEMSMDTVCRIRGGGRVPRRESRVVFIADTLCLIVPGLVTDTAGLGLGTVAIGSQWVCRRNLLRAAAAGA
jgi:hypothetical protein